MNTVPHLGFIVAAYGVTALVLGGAVAALLHDRRTQTRLLARFDRSADPSRRDRA